LKNNRRNYYRILQIQPDASPEVIKANYRTLMQKLKLHPDLGGENWNASSINQAYSTLRNPVKRAKYDQELLREYKISMLSKGHLDSKPGSPKRTSEQLHDKHGNKRNYYRVLHVQADSPKEIIEASYRTLVKKENSPRELLKIAFLTLIDEKKRALYDQILADHSHPDAVNGKPHEDTRKDVKKEIAPNQGLVTHFNKRNIHINYHSESQGLHPKRPYIDAAHKSAYQPLIKNYCPFCKTPFSQSPCNFSVQLCEECDSPLYPPQKTLVKQPRRNLGRLERFGSLRIYTSWPGNAHDAFCSDVSPIGLRFTTYKKLDEKQIIKIDGEDFKAVGEVTYSNQDLDKITAGIKFLTIHFDKQKGHFLTESV
jgi:DnaJ domain